MIVLMPKKSGDLGGCSHLLSTQDYVIPPEETTVNESLKGKGHSLFIARRKI